MAPNLVHLSEQIAETVARVAPAMVAVEGRKQFASAGIHWRSGLIVTAEHASRREEEIGVTLPDGTRVHSRVVGRDPGTDLAVLRTEEGRLPIPAVSPTDPRAGQLALVVGRLTSSGATASLGVVSTVDGPWRTWRGGSVDQLIRLDVGMYPGSSGSGVFDAEGNILGMATSGLSRYAAVAIPAKTINRVLDELLERGHISRAFLGLGLQPVPLNDALRRALGIEARAGVIVLSVEPGGPAENAGALLGDILIGLEGEPVIGTDSVQGILAAHRPGETLTLDVIRGGGRRELAVVLGEKGGTEGE